MISHQKAFLRESGTNFSKIKERIDIIQSIATILAIVLAAAWFLVQRESFPKASISQIITHRQLNKEWIWVHTAVKISNEGKRLLTLTSGSIRIQHILPLEEKFSQAIQQGISLVHPEESQIPWPVIGKPYKTEIMVKIEPGEHEILYFDFIIPAFLKTIQVYSFFKKRDHYELGLSDITIYDLN